MTGDVGNNDVILRCDNTVQSLHLQDKRLVEILPFTIERYRQIILALQRST